MMDAIVWIALFLSGLAVRVALLHCTSAFNILSKRIEISTPLTSWIRVTEGVHLYDLGISPYEGSGFHEPPLALLAYWVGIKYAQDWIPYIFMLCDLITAYFLMISSKKYLEALMVKESDFAKASSSKNLPPLVSATENHRAHLQVATAYLLCPYSVASCIGRSTSVFSNLILSLLFYCTVSGRSVLAAALIAIAMYQSLYPIILVVPVALFLEQNKTGCSPPENRVLYCVWKTARLVVVFGAALVYISYKAMGSFDFLWPTYGCILSVPDLTPNIGLFWYFFTEMFEHFRSFFLWVFQINTVVYVLPLAFRFRSDPGLLYFILASLIAAFKSYPTIGDIAFYLSLMPTWKHLFPYMRQLFIVGCVMVTCTVLAPVLWHLWIYTGSANSNFYFGITLAFNTAQIFLLTDILFAYVKREYYLQHGKQEEIDGKPARLELR